MHNLDESQNTLTFVKNKNKAEKIGKILSHKLLVTKWRLLKLDPIRTAFNQMPFCREF